ncbi:MAG: Sec-independent protein translocase, TatC subunit [Frankiales bacterium]|nr:Sec-independent protein translocase, TatC subunit [Frankiales bacterium]
MPLVEHIKELRRRLVISAIAVLIGVGAAYALWEPLFHFLRQPYCDAFPKQKCDLYVTGVFDQFNTRMKIAFIGGIVATSPIWLYQVGAFFTPALHKHERRYAGGFLTGALALFAAGVSVAYISVGHGLKLLLHVAGPGVQNITTLKEYFSFLTLMLMLFGIAFEFPVLIVFLNLAGVLSYDRMKRWHRAMAFAVYLAAAVLTPSTDPFTFLILGTALYALWWLSVAIAWVRDRRKRGRLADEGFDVDDDETSFVDSTPSQL